MVGRKSLIVPDNNPMLRDGVTGDWCAALVQHHGNLNHSCIIGLAHSLVTKEHVGKPASPPTLREQPLPPQIFQRRSLPSLPFWALKS